MAELPPRLLIYQGERWRLILIGYWLGLSAAAPIRATVRISGGQNPINKGKESRCLITSFRRSLTGGRESVIK